MQAVQLIAIGVILSFALWVAAGSLVAVARPATARGWIARFATSHRINIAEQAWRALAGAALLVRADASLSPDAFRVVGAILIASAAILLVVPLRWHSSYAVWWSQNLPLWAVRVAGLAGLGIAGAAAVSTLG